MCVYFIAILLAFTLMGCTKKKDSKQIYSVKADLTHDGEKDCIEVELTDILKDNQQMAHITVYSGNDKELWQADLGIPHDAWGSYYLVEMDDLSYLLHYVPENTQGKGNYSYEVFYLTEDGKEVEIASNSISFDTYPGNNLNFPKKDIINFATEVNQYLGKATLLLSTMYGELEYSTTDNKVAYMETYKNILETAGLEVSDTVETNVDTLEKYLLQ